MARYNDINMKEWKSYGDIQTDSLWIIEKRDNSGVHSGEYHGNFVPQIPYQLFSRFTQRGDWILDPFMGSGTSLIEAQRMERNSIGIELQEEVAKKAYEKICKEKNEGTISKVIVDDSRVCDIKGVIKEVGIKNVQFVIMHPPYWDILKFSEQKEDLSNCDTVEDFLNAFGQVVDNIKNVLEKERYCAVIMGDKYANSQIVPLGFLCMNLMVNKGFKLKAILVKNFDETKGKSNKQGIWRYRALSSDFYIFKHEYIFVFKSTR